MTGTYWFSKLRNRAGPSLLESDARRRYFGRWDVKKTISVALMTSGHLSLVAVLVATLGFY